MLVPRDCLRVETLSCCMIIIMLTGEGRCPEIGPQR